MKHISFLALFFSSYVCLAQSKESKDRWGELKIGMSEPQIVQLVGEPLHYESFTTVKYGTFDSSAYWRYTNERVIIVTNHLFERTEKNRAELLAYIQQRASKKDKDGLIIVNHGKK